MFVIYIVEKRGSNYICRVVHRMRVEFGITTPEVILRNSVIEVTDPRCTANDGTPIKNGLRDPRFGIIGGGKCPTCQKNRHSCPGHWGHLKLAVPLYHISWVPIVIQWLRSVCHKCGTLLWRTEGTLQKKASKSHHKCPSCKVKQCKYSWDKDKASIMQNKVRYTALQAMEHLKAHRQDLFLTYLPVPPLNMRPAVVVGTKTRGESDLTYRLQAIVRRNRELTNRMTSGQPRIVIDQALEHLQNAVTGYINHHKLGDSRGRKSRREYTSLTDRISSKEGRIRGCLMGKRVNFTARTVITPSDKIKLTEVGVPRFMSKILTVPVRVTDWNLENVKRLIEEKRVRYIIKPDKSRVDVSLNGTTRIEPGYVVERHLQDGDVILFNRQPSLHKMSMMAHTVRLIDGLSFQLNVACTTPYNADFDGDEMNLHVPQTPESQAEARLIMGVQYQVVSPQANKPVISMIQDSVVGAWLLSADSISREDAIDGLYGTGHEVLSGIMPDINYNRNGVVIRRGKVLSGRFSKKVLGSSDGSLIHVIWLDAGPARAVQFMHDLERVVHAYLCKRGFTVCIADLIPSPTVKAKCADELRKAMHEVQGMSESKVNQRLNACRSTMGKIALEPLSHENNFLCMVESGSKGSLINLTQVQACLGQQNVSGMRPVNHWKGRTLPHFKRGDTSPEAKGFVSSSYIQGLSAHEFFFHSQSGREGLVDTAIKTATTGYLERRIMKSLENIRSLHGSARDGGRMISFLYGDDGFDAVRVLRQRWMRFPLHENDSEYAQWVEDCSLLESVPKDVSVAGTDDFYLPIAIHRIIDRHDPGTPPDSYDRETLNALIRTMPLLMQAFLRVHLTTARLRSLGVTSDGFRGISMGIERELARVRIDDGESVGSIAAQSLGERCTQLTLNTFHSCGDSSKNVTLGIPRMEELLNCSKRIATPFVSFRDIASGIEKHVTLGDIWVSLGMPRPEDDLSEFWAYPDPGKPSDYPEYRLELFPFMDVEALRKALASRGIWAAYTEGPRVVMHLYGGDVQDLKSLTVCGVKGCDYVERDGDWVETSYTDIHDLLEREIDVNSIYTSDIHVMHQLYGIEATREILIREIRAILKHYGIYLNARHLKLLGDYMTWDGLTPLTRHGMKKLVTSPLKKCTFEEVCDVLHRAAVFKEVDPVEGVSECILTGQQIKMGSNAVTVIKDHVMERVYQKPSPMSIDPFDIVDSWMPTASHFVEETPLYDMPVQPSPGFAPPSPGFAPPSPGFAPPSPGFAPPSPGFAPPSPGFA